MSRTVFTAARASKPRGQFFFAFNTVAPRAASVLLLVCGLGCGALRPAAPPPGPAQAEVRVRLMHAERAWPGARVTAVRDLGVDLLEQAVHAQVGAEGRAGLALTPGIWYVSAAADQPPLFGWYGSNPIQVRAGETLDLSIPAVAAPPAAAADRTTPGEETIVGEVVGEGDGIAQAGVALYLDASTQFRGPGYIETRTDDRGAFAARVSPGRYWLVARRRLAQQSYGPLEIGDDFGYYPGNPVTVRPGERVSVRIPAVRVLKKSGWSAPSTARTRVGGTIRDPAGRPLAGYRAFLHAKATMLGKPEFVSEPSGPDGGYLIWVDREGVFYLGARAEIGRARGEGEVIGLYTGSPNHAVAVRLDAGQMPAHDIVVIGGGAP